MVSLVMFVVVVEDGGGSGSLAVLAVVVRLLACSAPSPRAALMRSKFLLPFATGLSDRASGHGVEWAAAIDCACGL